MKKYLFIIGALVLVASVVVATERTSDGTDKFSVKGADAYGVAIDASGNILPCAGTESVGSSDYPFADVRSASATITTITGTKGTITNFTATNSTTTVAKVTTLEITATTGKVNANTGSLVTLSSATFASNYAVTFTTGSMLNTTATPVLGGYTPAAAAAPATWIKVMILDANGEKHPAYIPIWQ